LQLIRASSQNPIAELRLQLQLQLQLKNTCQGLTAEQLMAVSELTDDLSSLLSFCGQ
jgi:predicted membrane chloride channel (bestrophin family)